MAHKAKCMFTLWLLCPLLTVPQIYLVDFDGSNLVELTSGIHGATHAPAFNRQGTKVAWLQLDEDGHESDRLDLIQRKNLVG